MAITHAADPAAQRFAFDAGCALVLFLVAVLGGACPMWLTTTEAENPSRSSLLHLGNMLSAGVMIAAGFVHLLGESIPLLGTVDLKPGSTYPLATFLCALGFVITLLADIAAQALSGPQAATSCTSSVLLPTSPASLAKIASKASKAAAPRNSGAPAARESLLPRHAAAASELTPGAAAPQQRSRATARLPEMTIRSAASEEEGDALEGWIVPEAGTSNGNGALYSGAASNGMHGATSPAHRGSYKGRPTLGDDEMLPAVTYLSACLMAFALSVHSLLEGAALGSQQTVRNAESIMIAISAHKGLAAYALGSSVISSEAGSRLQGFWPIMAGFSLATPVGIFLGYLVSVEEGKMGAGLSALASGTFIYVATMEVLPRELALPYHKGPKLAAFCVGFAAMSLLAIWS